MMVGGESVENKRKKQGKENGNGTKLQKKEGIGLNRLEKRPLLDDSDDSWSEDADDLVSNTLQDIDNGDTSYIGLSHGAKINESNKLKELSENADEVSVEENEGDFFTVEEAVNRIGLGWFQADLLLVLGLMSVTDALQMQLLAVLSPVLKCEWLLSESQVAFITTIVFIGMLVGSVTWGKYADLYGRRPIIIIGKALIFYTGVLTSFSPNYYWVVLLRGMVGVGFGAGVQTATLLSEYLPAKHRARIFLAGGLFWAVGTVFEMLLAYLVLPTLGWRWLVGLSALPSAISLLFLKRLPESARFLLAAGRKEEALEQLKRLARTNKSSLPSGELVQDKLVQRGNIKDLFVPEYRCTSVLLWLQWFAMTFSYYGVVILTASPEILNHPKTCGAEKMDDAIPAHDDCHCHLRTESDYWSMILASFGEFVGLPLSLLTIDTIGRRRTLALFLFVSAAFFFLTQACTTSVWMTVFVFGIRAFSTGGVIYLYTTEVYPTTLRSVGLGLCSSMARVGAMITPFCSQVLISWSLPAAVSTYGFVSLFCGVNALLLPIETKGRELLQSQ